MAASHRPEDADGRPATRQRGHPSRTAPHAAYAMGDQPHLQRDHPPDDAVPRTLAAGARAQSGSLGCFEVHAKASRGSAGLFVGRKTTYTPSFLTSSW